MILGVLFVSAMNLTFSMSNFYATSTSIRLADVHAGFQSGNLLLDFCNSDEFKDLRSFSYCTGYIAAIADLDNGTCILKQNSYFKLPENITQSQLRKVVVKWLNQNPEKLNFGAASLVEVALSESFPCKQPSQK